MSSFEIPLSKSGVQATSQPCRTRLGARPDSGLCSGRAGTELSPQHRAGMKDRGREEGLIGGPGGQCPGPGTGRRVLCGTEKACELTLLKNCSG